MAREDDPVVNQPVRFFFCSFNSLNAHILTFHMCMRRMDTQVLEKKKTGGYYSIKSEAVTPCGCRVGVRAGRLDCYHLRH